MALALLPIDLSPQPGCSGFRRHEMSKYQDVSLSHLIVTDFDCCYADLSTTMSVASPMVSNKQ